MAIACGDESWDVESDCSADSDVAASVESSGKPGDIAVARKTAWPAMLPSMKTNIDGSDSETDSDDNCGAERICAASSAKIPLHQRPAKPTPAPSELVAQLPPPEAVPKSLKGQAAYLRQENTWLRNALTKLQHEAEKTAETQASGEAQTLDFAHLLELAREFGEGLEKRERQEDYDEWYSEDASTAEPGSISISTPDSTPRGEGRASPGGGPDVEELKAQLAESNHEVSMLKAQIAERDLEIAKLRKFVEVAP